MYEYYIVIISRSLKPPDDPFFQSCNSFLMSASQSNSLTSNFTLSTIASCYTEKSLDNQGRLNASHPGKNQSESCRCDRAPATDPAPQVISKPNTFPAACRSLSLGEGFTLSPTSPPQVRARAGSRSSSQEAPRPPRPFAHTVEPDTQEPPRALSPVKPNTKRRLLQPHQT